MLQGKTKNHKVNACYHPDFKKVITNVGWLFADKILRLGVGLVVGVWIARFLGPQQFGLWNYSIAFTSLFSGMATLGLDSIVVRELAKYPEQKNELMGSAFVLKLLGGVIAFIVTISAISIISPEKTLTIKLVSISAAGFIFQSLNVIDFFYQSKVKSKYPVIAANCAFTLITLVKIILIVKSASLLSFAWTGLGEVALTAIFLVVSYKNDHNEIRSWKYDNQTAKELINGSWPLILSSIAVMIQARIDQVMLGGMIDNEELGQYSAAMRLIEIFAFVPVIIVSTLAPYITRGKMTSEALYYEMLLGAYRVMFVVFLIVAVPIFLFGQQIVDLFFGDAYKRAGFLLSLFAMRLFFTNFGVARSLFITNESLFRYKTGLALVYIIEYNVIDTYLFNT